MLKLVLVLVASGTALALRGVPQSRVALYAGKTFKCADGVEIEASRINDEYCDCTDGDDEPGTSACGGGHFYCVNRGHRGTYLSSSRVDDGVCDCCDGSDEGAHAGCVNTCAEAAAAAQASQRANIATLEAGARAKQALAQKAQEELREKGIALASAKADIQAKEQEKQAAEERKAAAEKEETAARNAAVTAAETKAHTVLAIHDLTADALRAVLLKLVRNTALNEDAVAAVYDTVASHRRESGLEGQDDPTSEAVEAATKERERVEKERQQTKQQQSEQAPQGECFLELFDTAVGASEGGWHASIREGATEYALSSRQADWTAKGIVDDGTSAARLSGVAGAQCTAVLYETPDFSGWSCELTPGDWSTARLESVGCHNDGVSSFKLRNGYVEGNAGGAAPATATETETETPLPEVPSRGKVLRDLVGASNDVGGGFKLPAAEEARAAATAAEVSWNNAKRQVDDLEKELGEDYGEDKAFWALKGRTIEVRVGQYMYKVRAFDAAHQDSTSLGNWKGWDGPAAADGTRVMKFENGQKCWNGPQRSLKVTVKCGEEDKLTDVTEASTCVYAAVLLTPAACDVRHAQKLNLELEESEYEPPHPQFSGRRDEL